MKLRARFLAVYLVMSHGGIALAAANLVAQTRPVTIDLEWQDRGGAIEIKVDGIGGAGVAERVAERDLLLQFDRPITVNELEKLPAAMPDWVATASAGFDTVLLVAARDVRYSVAKNGSSITVAMAPTAVAQAPKDEEGDARSQARLDLLEARLFSIEGEPEQARRALGEFLRRQPDNGEAWAALGALEESAGRWRRALSHYDRSLELDPQNEDVARSREMLKREHSSYVRIDMDRRKARGGERRWSMPVTGEVIVGPAARMVFAFEAAQSKTQSVRRLDGSVADFNGWRERLEVGIQIDRENGDRFRALLVGNQETLGLATDYLLIGDDSQTLFQLDFRRPNWDLVETLVNDGWRDRVRVEHRQTLLPNLTGRVGVGLNRYGFDGLADAARTLTVDGDLTYTIRPDDPNIAVVYGFDGEYVGRKAERTDATGTSFSPAPLTEREVHSLALNLGQTIEAWSTQDHSTWRAEGYAGIGKDRYGQAGPMLGASLTRRGLGNGPWSPLDAQLRGSYVKNIGRNGDTVGVLGGYVRWRF